MIIFFLMMIGGLLLAFHKSALDVIFTMLRFLSRDDVKSVLSKKDDVQYGKD